FQAEVGILVRYVTGVHTCALPILYNHGKSILFTCYYFYTSVQQLIPIKTSKYYLIMKLYMLFILITYIVLTKIKEKSIVTYKWLQYIATTYNIIRLKERKR